jgi:hypothetical protein
MEDAPVASCSGSTLMFIYCRGGSPTGPLVIIIVGSLCCDPSCSRVCLLN